MSDVVKHEVKSIGEKVSDRIRASFVDLIPEDAWKAMVQKEIVTFTEGVQEPYGRGTKPSPLQSIIRAELESRFKAEVIKAMDAQEGCLEQCNPAMGTGRIRHKDRSGTEGRDGGGDVCWSCPERRHADSGSNAAVISSW